MLLLPGAQDPPKTFHYISDATGTADVTPWPLIMRRKLQVRPHLVPTMQGAAAIMLN
jgi:hypothetical protein